MSLLGAEATVSEVVTAAMTARAVGSGETSVLATPAILALVERAAAMSVERRLPNGQTTVGGSVELVHGAATPIGAIVEATARVEHVAGRRLEFSFRVCDPAGQVAGGAHVRVIVDRQRFEATAVSRRDRLAGGERYAS
jgi:predicted thioesterase